MLAAGARALVSDPKRLFREMRRFRVQWPEGPREPAGVSDDGQFRIRTFFGRVFNYPYSVFPEEMLRPEKQDMAVFTDGVDNIVTTHQRVAEGYFADGSVEMACPPLRPALLHIMARGHHEGCGVADAGLRALFTRESVLGKRLAYAARLAAKQRHDIQLWRKHATYLENFLKKKNLHRRSPAFGNTGKTGEVVGNPSPGQNQGLLDSPQWHHRSPTAGRHRWPGVLKETRRPRSFLHGYGAFERVWCRNGCNNSRPEGARASHSGHARREFWWR